MAARPIWRLGTCEESHIPWFSSIASPAHVRTRSRESITCVIGPRPAIHGRASSLKKSRTLSAACATIARRVPDRLGCQAYRDGMTVFEDAQLFQRLGLLQRRARQPRIASEEAGAIGIDADVA